MEYSNGSSNAHYLACMIASWRNGLGVLPQNLGLSQQSFNELMDYNFPGLTFDDGFVCENPLDLKRIPEREDLVQLFLEHQAAVDKNEQWLAEISATACIGFDHLWQDMGLWSRKALSGMIQHNFPGLAALNNRDMKWKKFLYKQLCLKEGIYICRAPSCDVCADYQNCFGSEEA